MGREISVESTDTADATMRFRAAQYMRMSTEHQKHSIENQSDIIRQYAASRNVEIVDTYIETGTFQQPTSGPR